MVDPEAQVSRLKKWIIAARPWALPASTMPVIFGTSLAIVIGGARFKPFHFLLALLSMVILHSAANMLSDVFDFKRGLDKDVTPVSGAIVRGWLSTKAVTAGAMVLFVLGSAIGLILVWLTGKVLLIIGAVGVAIGLFYSALKYRALGDFAVFFDFGILGSLGAWVVQTRSFSPLPAIWAVPMAMLVIAILHANNWRDTITDGERRVKTMASLLGDRGSLAYYALLIFGSMAIIFGLILIPRFISPSLTSMPSSFIIIVLALPKALNLWERAVRRREPLKPMDFIILDGATANYNLVFGLLCTAAVWLHYLLRIL